VKYQNIVVTVSNYATKYLDETLDDYGQQGFELVNVVMAKNKYMLDVMYLFFTKEMRGDADGNV
jgi:hypothetical protein